MEPTVSICLRDKDGVVIRPTKADLLSMDELFDILKNITQLDKINDGSIIGYGDSYTEIITFKGPDTNKDDDDLILKSSVYQSLLKSVQMQL